MNIKEILKLKKIFSLLLIILFFNMSPLTSLASSSTTFNSSVKNDLDHYLEKVGGEVSITYENMISQEKYTYRPDATYFAASTVKLPLALYIMELADAQEIDLNQKLTYQNHHYVGGSGVIQNDSFGTQFTIKELLSKSMKYSDNIAFAMLVERVGQHNFSEYMNNLGARNNATEAYSYTSTNDLNIFAKKLYSYSFRSDHGQLLDDYLQNTVYNDALPQRLGELQVAHKVGMMPIDQVSHDYGVVYAKSPYTLSVMTYGFDYAYSNEVIADITEIIHKNHEAFNKRNDLSIIDRIKIAFITITHQPN
ncbi:hypothetical protein DF281_13640 [Kurthia zopfii]|nr:hypothetical protein DF281_13640 [Kurthia zopfii]